MSLQRPYDWVCCLLIFREKLKIEKSREQDSIVMVYFLACLFKTTWISQLCLKNLRDEVSCPVCQNIFKDPRHLSCQHSFCFKCLQNWHQTSGGGNAIRCPKCQTLSSPACKWCQRSFQPVFISMVFIDVLAIKDCNTTQVRCRKLQ